MNNYNFRDRNYVLDSQGNIFKIIGDCHDDFVVSYLKYYPHPDGLKIFDNKPYLTNTHVFKSFYLLSNFKNKMKYSYNHGACVTGTAVEDIVNVFDARKKLKNILNNKDQYFLSRVGKALLQLLDFFKKEKINLNDLGITGSFLVDMDNEQSDIDLVCYGEEAYKKILAFLQRSEHLQKYEGKYFAALCKRRETHMPSVSPAVLRIQESRKAQAMFQGIHFNVQPLRNDKDLCHAPISYVDIGDITIVAKVIEDKESIFAPAIYEVDDVVVVEGYKMNTIQSKIKHVISFIGAYSQIAKKGEHIFVKGTLLRAETKNNIFYTVSVDPWNRGLDNKIQVLR